MKKVFLGFIALFTAVLLVACGPMTNPNPPRERLVEWIEFDQDLEFTNEAITINFWHRKGVDNNNLLMQHWIPAFNQLFPNITVNTRRISGSYDDLQAAIRREIQFGGATTVPDVMESYPDHVLSYMPVVAREFALPVALNNFITHPNFGMEADDWLDIFAKFREESQYDQSAALTSTRPEDFNEEFEISGSIMSLPYLKSTEVMIFDRALFERLDLAVPTTWEELATVGQKMIDDGVRTTPVRGNTASIDRPMIPLGYDSSANFFITASLQYGAPFTSLDENNVGHIEFNNSQSIDMMTYFADLVTRRILTTRNLEFGGIAGAFLSNAFRAGQIAAYIGSSAGVRNSFEGPGATNPGVTTTEGTSAAGILPAVAPVPHFEGKGPQQIQQGPNISMFYNGNEQRAIASWLFMKFVTSAEINAQFITNQGGAQGAPGNMPSRASTLQTQTWLNFQNSVFRHEYGQFDIPVSELLALSPNDLGSRIAFDTIMLSLANVDYFFVTVAFDRSSRVRAQVGTLVDQVFTDAVSGTLTASRMAEIFEDRYLASW